MCGPTANIMRAFGQALDPDQADAEALRRYERAGITFSPMLDGGFAITGTADETTGAADHRRHRHRRPARDQATPGPRPAGGSTACTPSPHTG